jgi:hypothetical protein
LAQPKRASKAPPAFEAMTEQLDHDTPAPSPEDLVDVSLLPPGLRMLCRVLGHKTAFELCKQRGGVPLCVPAALSVDHHLVGIIGMDGLAALVAEMAREVIDVPKYDSVAMQLRHRTVRTLLNRGQGPTTVALATGYTKRQVVNLKRELAEADALLNTQADLFGFLPADEQAEIEAALAGDDGASVGPVECIDDAHKAAATRKHGAHNPFGI